MPLTDDQIIDRITASWRLRFKARRSGVTLTRELVAEAVEHRHAVKSLESMRHYLQMAHSEEDVEERFGTLHAPEAVWLRAKAKECGSTILVILSILSLVIKLWEWWRDRETNQRNDSA